MWGRLLLHSDGGLMGDGFKAVVCTRGRDHPARRDTRRGDLGARLGFLYPLFLSRTPRSILF